MHTTWEVMSSNTNTTTKQNYDFVHLIKHVSEHYTFISSSNFVWHVSSFLNIILQTLSYLFFLFLPMISIWKMSKVVWNERFFWDNLFNSHTNINEWVLETHIPDVTLSVHFSFPSTLSHDNPIE
jgi:hypothetical protein